MKNLICTVLILSSAASASSLYSVSVIPPPSGFTGVLMHGINNSGQAAGYGNNGTTDQAFLGTTSGSAAIPAPAGFQAGYGLAWSLTSSGEVAGYGSNGGFQQSMIGTPGGTTAIPMPAGFSFADAFAVNDSGEVAGNGYNGSALQAFSGTTSGTTAIPFPTGWTSSAATGINSSGHVAGYGNNGTTDEAFIDSTAIPLIAGWNTVFGEAINDSGDVVGYGNNGTANQAFFYDGSASTAIPLPTGGSFADVTEGSVNDSGMVVGASDLGGWIWDASNGLLLLNSVVPAGWYISDAVSISNNGLILAIAQFDAGAPEYVELALPEPGTYALVGLGLLLAAAAKRRSQSGTL
jgi:hypothetical protein